MSRLEGLTSANAALQTHQEAHEVEGEDGRHPAERQALEHGAADAGRVAEVLGGGIGRRRRAALFVGACLRPPHDRHQYQCSVHHCSMLTTCQTSGTPHVKPVSVSISHLLVSSSITWLAALMSAAGDFIHFLFLDRGRYKR